MPLTMTKHNTDLCPICDILRRPLKTDAKQQAHITVILPQFPTPAKSGTMDGGFGRGNVGEGERWCQIAGKLLEARDLLGCKQFAERAMDADPLLDGVDQIMAAADVLLASQRRINNHLDWYSILQLQPSFDAAPDLTAVKRAYRRLALLLHPDKNHLPGASQAFRLVCDAWAFLSDPTKKRLYDDEIKIAAHLRSNGRGETAGDGTATTTQAPPPSFWTMCSACFRAYEYGKEYQGKMLVCQSCRKPFEAKQLPTVPPIVPGTDMYYCSWGLFPLGFPGAPVFNGVVIPDGTPCIPSFPGAPPQKPPGDGHGGMSGTEKQISQKGKAVETTPSRVTTRNQSQRTTRQTPPTAVRSNRGRPRKVLANKPKKDSTESQQQQQQQQRQQTEIFFGGEGGGMKNSGLTAMGQNSNDKVGCSVNAGDFGGGFDMNSFSIDLDATAAVLGNLANLPFLKDDEIGIMR